MLPKRGLGVTIQPLTAELAKGFNVTEGPGALIAGVLDRDGTNLYVAMAS